MGAGQIRDYWTDYKFRNRELKYGTVTRYFEEKNYGFMHSTWDAVLGCSAWGQGEWGDCGVSPGLSPAPCQGPASPHSGTGGVRAV